VTLRARLVALGVTVVLLLTGTVAYLVRAGAARAERERAASTLPSVSVEELSSRPRIVFRSTALGSEYGRVAMVSLSAPTGPRAFTSASCDRVFSAGDRTLCLASDQGLVTTYTAQVLADAGHAAVALPLTGAPSRARLSADGRLAATTSFVSGDSYASTQFSTRTVVTRLDTASSLDLETFALVHRGQRITPGDRNFWGVTFARDDDTFYVTAAFSGQTWLARGTLSTRTVTTVRSDAECPSLSPDGTKVAYKKRGNRAPGDWRLAVLDLASGRETVLTESRSVDDQVEWLDGDHVIYGLPGEGSEATQSNVWSVRADGEGRPSLLIPKAWSPAVVR
jgi:hypothetical protein